MKKLVVLYYFIIFIFITGCSNKENNYRLASNYNSNWGNEAVNYKYKSKDTITYTPTIAVLDTGCNIQNNNINQGFNISDNNNDITDYENHGTDIISKIIELNRNCKVIPIKVCNESSKISEDLFSNGILKAINLNVNIINISIGTETDYDNIRSAVDEALKHNIIIIASSGNYGGDLLYPAKYNNVISVMARDINNCDLSFNGKSNLKKSISAPGEHILCKNHYVTGTSIATAYVTGAVSIIYNYCNSVDYKKVYNILKSSCLYPTNYSHGIVNYKKIINKIT